ncbi:HNH endonuclease signature motif containing protein [Microbispora rosea]|nr:HNH endonuclease signature motif containing protein [Microbispora rosea]
MDLFDPDPDRPHRANNTDDGWWDRLTADSPLWSADGSSARAHFPITDLDPPQHTSANTSDGAPRAARDRGRSSWVLVGSLRESAQALALTPLPEDADVCLSEAEDLLFARDRITCALADRVGRVHAAGRAKQHGHASTRSWLRTAAGMSVGGAGRLLTLAVELARLPRVREKFAAGQLAAGVVEAICAATSNLSGEHAGVAEPILLELAGKAGAAEVAKAGRYLRAVLDPDGEDRDERAEYGRRFLRVRPGRGGGLEGEFSLPREAAARLRALLDAYAKPRAEGDDRPLSVRQADALIALLEQKIATELLVLVNAESLPTDPEADAGAESDAPAASADRATTGPRDEEARHPGPDERRAGERRAGERRAGECEPRDTASAASAEGDDTPPVKGEDRDRAGAQTGATHARRRGSAWPADGGRPSHAAPSNTTPSNTAPPPTAPSNTAPSGTAPAQAARPDPPPEDNSAHHIHAGPRPAREYPRGQDTASAGEPPEALSGTAPGALFGAPPGALLGTELGTVPGLLLATGQMLPVTSVHRLARTSTLMRLVMDAQGQVLDMGRKVRLATPAQRRAVFARYATCWIDGCPLPATMCQIDHADNWSTGGLTDLKLLGPACQFHNRDRYQHPHHYTRRQTGTDRWTFTYERPRPR